MSAAVPTPPTGEYVRGQGIRGRGEGLAGLLTVQADEVGRATNYVLLRGRT
jgi:hypothetical protein